MKKLTINMRGDVAEVLLYDVIGEDIFGGISAKTFRDQVKGIKAKTMNLRIDSPGGSVFEATTMMTALRDFKGRIEVDVDGRAFSAASVIAMAGDEIRMAQGAAMMIHDPYSPTGGNAAELRATADLLDKATVSLIDAYERHSKAGREQIAAWMKAETWFFGQEAVDAGLAHKVTEGRAIAAYAGFKDIAAKLGYKRVPESLTNPPRDEKVWADTERRRAIAASL